MIVGREGELQDVGELVAGTDAGPAVLVVEGEAVRRAGPPRLVAPPSR